MSTLLIAPEELDFAKLSDEIFNENYYSKLKPKKLNKPISITNNFIESSLSSNLYNKPELINVNADDLSKIASRLTSITF